MELNKKLDATSKIPFIFRILLFLFLPMNWHIKKESSLEKYGPQTKLQWLMTQIYYGSGSEVVKVLDEYIETAAGSYWGCLL